VEKGIGNTMREWISSPRKKRNRLKTT